MAESKLCKDTETKGSDEILELFCEACYKEGNKVEVCAYCSDCDEYFCTICQKYHARFLKDHTILNGDNIPKDVERCKLHKQIIKLYCTTCEEFACCMCTTHSSLTSAQKPCKVTPVAELSNDIEESDELRNFTAKLDESLSKFVNMKQNEPEIENIAAQAKQEVQKLKDKILAKVEQMNSEIDKRKQTDSDKLQTITAKTNALITKLEEVSKKINQKRSNVRTQKSQKFIVMKQMKSEIESLDQETDEITAEMDQLKYIFEPDTSIINVTEEIQTFGTLVTESEAKETEKVEIKKRKLRIAAVHQYDILDQVNEIQVKNFCAHSGEVLAICDSNDNSVKLFNASRKSVMASLKFNTTPTAITYVGKRQFAVAQYHHKKQNASTITFLIRASYNTLNFKGKNFEVNSECLDIIRGPCKHSLIVLLRDETNNESRVQILNMSGIVLETFYTNPSDSTELFSKFSWITLNKNQNILYATNLQNDELITIHLDMEEENEDRIKTSFLLAPNGLACDSQGNIYISLHGHNKIIYYYPKSCGFRDLLTESDDIYAPETLKYCEDDNLLYVWNGNTINVFKIIIKDCVFKETLQKVWKWEPISTSEFS